MQVFLDYGKGRIAVDVPDRNLVEVLEPDLTPGMADVPAAVRRSIEDPIGSVPLAELCRGKKSACIAVSDITRPVPNRIILPSILETLEKSGISRDRILILIATGMHGESDPEKVVGEEIAGRYRVENHAGTKKEDHMLLGVTRRGAPALVDKRFMKADLHLAVGLVEPHLMAGYSGGRKSVCPGLVHLETMRFVHAPAIMEHDCARTGVLQGNPFHEEALLIARMARVDFITNVTINKVRQVTGVFSGELEKAHIQAVELARKQVVARAAREADLVIASGGGYPLDATFYQSIKGYVAALPAVKQGGMVLVAAELSDCIGSREFTDLLMSARSPEDFMKRLMADEFFVMDQWMVEHLCQVHRKCRPLFFTEGLERDILEELLVEPVRSPAEAVEIALKVFGSRAAITVIPQGPYTLVERV